jgi:hypothetical protein
MIRVGISKKKISHFVELNYTFSSVVSSSMLTLLFLSLLPFSFLTFLWTPWFMNPEVQSRIHKSSPIVHVLSRINPIL